MPGPGEDARHRGLATRGTASFNYATQNTSETFQSVFLKLKKKKTFAPQQARAAEAADGASQSVIARYAQLAAHCSAELITRVCIANADRGLLLRRNIVFIIVNTG